jgi:hypothetical protein
MTLPGMFPFMDILMLAAQDSPIGTAVGHHDRSAQVNDCTDGDFLPGSCCDSSNPTLPVLTLRDSPDGPAFNSAVYLKLSGLPPPFQSMFLPMQIRALSIDLLL